MHGDAPFRSCRITPPSLSWVFETRYSPRSKPVARGATQHGREAYKAADLARFSRPREALHPARDLAAVVRCIADPTAEWIRGGPPEPAAVRRPNDRASARTAQGGVAAPATSPTGDKLVSAVTAPRAKVSHPRGTRMIRKRARCGTSRMCAVTNGEKSTVLPSHGSRAHPCAATMCGFPARDHCLAVEIASWPTQSAISAGICRSIVYSAKAQHVSGATTSLKKYPGNS